VPAFNKKKKK
jgi:hypothetical protein